MAGSGCLLGMQCMGAGLYYVPGHWQLLAQSCKLPQSAQNFCGWGDPVAGNAATWFVLPTMHMGGCAPQSHLCPGTLSRHRF